MLFLKCEVLKLKYGFPACLVRVRVTTGSLSEKQDPQEVCTVWLLWAGSLHFGTVPAAPLCLPWPPQARSPAPAARAPTRPSNKGRPAVGQPGQVAVWNTGCRGQISVNLTFFLLIRLLVIKY